MNEREAGLMAAALVRRGWEVGDAPEGADLVVLHTCSVRAAAEQKAFGFLGRLRRRAAEGAVVAVCGCAVEGASERILRRYPFVSILLGPRRLGRIADAAEAAARGERTVLLGDPADAGDAVVGAAGPVTDDTADAVSPAVPGVTAWVTAMQGCSNACTFCVVPSRRGPAVSRPVDEVVREVERLAAAGYREATLLGQNVSFYGLEGIAGAVVRPPPRRRPGDPPRLADLLAAVDGRLPRIRFATSHPRYVDADLLDRFPSFRTVCPSLHLPVQSGSDRILKRMGRLHTRAEFLEVVRGWRAAAPEGRLSTDIIIGFPGETEAEFEETLSLVREAAFEMVYPFAYSPRPGTPASALEAEAVPAEERSRRLRRLGDVTEEVASAATRALVGREVEVLVEGPAPMKGTGLAGRARNGRAVILRGASARPGETVRVRIETAGPWSAVGTAVPDRAVA